MAEQRPRRVGGSRNPIGRPRKVAGGPRPAPERLETAADDRRETAPPPVATPDDAAVEPGVEPAPSRQPRSVRSIGGRRTTLALLVVVVVFAVVAAAELVYLVRGDSPTISAARPVVTGELTHRAAVEAAATSTEQILSTSYQDYDQQVEQATRKMTPTFAKEYRQTADGLKEKYAQQQLKLQVKAVAQGVVQASPQQVQALLFLNQYVEKTENGQPATSFAQYRALVTVVRTSRGWLVSDIETQ